MKRFWVCAAFLCGLCGTVWAFQSGQDIFSLLDSGGGPQSTGVYQLRGGSLGQPFQTGDLTGGIYRLRTGFLPPSKPRVSEGLPGDFNADGAVDFTDFILFAAGFGRTKGETDYNGLLDLNGNGQVDFPDFLMFASLFET